MKRAFCAKTLISAGLCAALVVLSPGLPCYQALAADFQAPGAAGLPAPGAFAARLSALATPGSLAQLQGQTLHGVDVAQVLTALSSVDLGSPAGQAQAAPALAALSALPAGASDARLVEAVAQAAAQARRDAQAAVFSAGSEKQGQNGLSAAEARLKIVEGSILLTPAQREEVSRALSDVRARLSQDKEEKAAARIAAAERDWAAASWENEGGAVAGRESRVSSSGLSKAAPGAEPARAPAVARWKKAAAAGSAAAAAGLTLAHGFNPVTWLVVAGTALSVLLHETAHLAVLRWRGDDTAARHGVSSANPLRLVDPLGTIGLPALSAALSGAFLGVPVVFGWAKPVPVDFNRPADRRLSAFLIAAAGPAANFALAAAFGALAAAHVPLTLALAASSLAAINVILGAFNLLPLPQLDGGKMLISALPRKLYLAVTRNSRIPPAYDKLSRRLYEGPSAILNWLRMDGQGRVNWTTRLITLGAFVAFAGVAHLALGGPILLAMLVCSYDYYCIREKIQNEAAVKSLIDILQGFSSEVAQAAEEDESIKSMINPEEVEHSLKNALEDTIDKVVDSDGFDALTEEQKWERFEAAYKDAAVAALKAKGMSADDPETIRKLLESERGKRFMNGVREWMKQYDVFGKWHSPSRKQDVRDAVRSKGKTMLGGGGKVLGMLAVAFLGAHFGMTQLPGLMGTTESRGEGAPAQPSFEESLNDPKLQLSAKEKQFLLQFVSEMKLEEKPPVTGRVEEMVRAYKNVTAPRGDISSVVLIGEAGVGKTAIVEKLAQQIALSEQSSGGTFSMSKMAGRYLVRLDLSRILIQDNPAAALDALLTLLRKFNDPSKKTGNKVILFADEIHKLFQVSQGEQMANLLKEPLRDGSLAIIAATTRKEYKEYFEKDDAFRRRMVPIWVNEASNQETLRSLQGARSYYEGLYDAKIAPEALQAATELSKYDQEIFLPGRAFKYLLAALREASFESQSDRVGMRIADKASELQYVAGRLSEELSKTSRVTTNIKEDEPTTIDLYNEAIRLTQELVALYRKRAAIPSSGTPTVTADMVKEAISEETGIAAGQLSLGREPMDKYLNMEKLLGERVIGQQEAIHVIAEAVRQNKAGLSNPNRPIGSFYLTGPTGSGKTHLAKELARFLFGDPKAVIRFDMSEYMEPHSVSRLFGSPPGYVGSMEGGQLTEKVRRQPYSVLLFDEFEKAHPDVKLALLQVLDDGRMTDGMGHTTDFKNTIILMTSNLGMYAVDVEPYVQAFHELRERKRAAQAAGDAIALAEIDGELKTLTERLSGETKAQSVAATQQAMKEAFPPEFEGRLSGPPVVFNRITPEMAAQIVELNLAELKKTMAYAGHELTWDKKAVESLVDNGFDLRLGARPLNTAIDRYVTQIAAKRILEAAQAGDGKVEPLKIVVTADKSGKLQVKTEPLPAKVASKKDPGEGAPQDVFAKVLTAAMQLAAGDAAHEVTLGTIDSWIKAAIMAYPENEQAAAAGREPSQPALQEAPPAVATVEAPAPAKAPALFQAETPVSVGAAALKAQSAHYQADAKDAEVLAFKKKAVEALEQAGYPREIIDALTRTVPAKDDPYLGFLPLFVEHAKSYTPADRRATPLQLSLETTEAGVKLVIHRNGPMSDAELSKLKSHLTGPAPSTSQAAREKAEALAVMNKPNSRLLLELYRVLSQIPGAELGYASGAKAAGGAGVDYWVELPKPAPKAPAPEPKTPEEGERAQPPAGASAPEAGAQAAAEPTQGLTVAPSVEAPEMGQYSSMSLDLDAANADDQGFKDARETIARRMAHFGYGEDSKSAMVKFVDAVAQFQKERSRSGAQDGERGLSVHFRVDGGVTRVVVTRLGAALPPEEIELLHALFDGNPRLRDKIREAGGQVWYGSGSQSYQGRGASVWLDLPPPGASSQADGQARASSTSSTGEADRARAWTSQAVGLDDDLAAAAGRVEAAARAAGVGGLAAQALRDFVLRAGRYARTRISAAQKTMFIEWRRVEGAFQAAVRVDAGESFGSVAWHGDVHDDADLIGRLTEARAQLFNDPVDSALPSGFAQRLSAQVQAGASAPAPELHKIVTPDPARPGDPPGALRVEFRRGTRYESEIVPLLRSLGLTPGRSFDDGDGYSVEARVDDAAGAAPATREAALKALDLSADARVLEVEVHPDVLRAALDEAEAAEQRAAGLRGPRTYVNLDFTKQNLQDPSFVQAKNKLAELLEGLGASGDLEDMTRKFIDAASRFAKEKARLHGERITLEWRKQGRSLELSVRRESAQPKDFRRQDWLDAVSAEPRLSSLISGARARLSDGPAAVPGKFSHAVTLTFTVPDPSAGPRQAAAETPARPAAPEAPGSAAQRARDQFRRFAYALLAQGSERGITVRIAAAEALAAASSAQDLAKAREWLALTAIDTRHAEIAAGALMAARHGSRADDEAALRDALRRLGDKWGHEYHPSQRAIAQALTRVLASDNPERIQALMAELRSLGTGGADKLLAEALFAALCAHAGPEAREALEQKWSSSLGFLSPELFDYYRRVDPGYLRGLLAAWRQTRALPDGIARFMTLYAIAEYGDDGDLPHFFRIVRTNWNGALGIEAIPLAADAFGRYVARLDLIDEVRPELRDWAQEDLHDGSTFGHVMAAVVTFGLAGDEQDLPLLERIVETDPGYGTVNNYHEMSQHEAGVAWARIVHRAGLVGRYLTEAEPAPAGGQALPRLLRMLTAQHGVVNKAALEALKLFFSTPVPPRRPRRARQATAPVAFFTQGERSPEFEDARTVSFGADNDSGLANAAPEPLASAAWAWQLAVRDVLQQVLGAAVERQYSASTDGRGTVWRLRSPLGRDIPLDAATRASWVLARLVALLDMPASEREAALSELEAAHPRIREAYAAVAALKAIPGVRLGVARLTEPDGTNRFEAWLHALPRALRPPPADGPTGPQTGGGPVQPHRHLADAAEDAARGRDPLRPHGWRGDRDY